MSNREVRCCCDGHLIGYLPAQGREGDVVRFIVHHLVSQHPLTSDEEPEVTVETLELEVAPITVPSGGEYPDCHFAYKSRDYPLEMLRLITGWVDLEPEVGRD